MRGDPVSAVEVLRALELFGPQARPYNFDDMFDCWGLVRRVFDHLDDGYEVNEQLGEAGDGSEAGWRRIDDPAELVPGDLLTTHPHADGEFHTVFFCGEVGGELLVYDSSPRGLIPLFVPGADGWRPAGRRKVFTVYGRATETTDRLRDDGGAYLRLWDDRQRYYNAAFHERLVAGARDGAGGGAQRDLVALRRAAGLSDLPFYCRRPLPRDHFGRETYDNRHTRRLDYYVPGGAPLLDDDYERLAGVGGPDETVSLPRTLPADVAPPAPPRLAEGPSWAVTRGPVEAAWEYPDPGVDGCRLELWEETADLWKHRLLREDHDEPLTRFSVPTGLLHPGSRFALVVFARAAGRWSGGLLVPFLYRPAADDPLLEYNAVRPDGLDPDEGRLVEPGRDVALRWRIHRPRRHQAQARVEVYEGGRRSAGAPLVFERELAGADAAACRCTLPSRVWLRPGYTYFWHVTAWDQDGRACFAPAEGAFTVAKE